MTHLLLDLKQRVHGHWSKMIRAIETNVGSSERIYVGRIATGLFFVIQTFFLSGCKDTGGQVIGYVNGVLNRATLSASTSSVTLNEGSSATVTIRFNHPITKATTLDWSVNATTSEFSAVSGTITVPLDAQSVSLVLTSVDNVVADGTRAYMLSVSGSIVDFVNDLSLSLSILDDESATSMTWNFATTGDYTYDTNYIDLSSGTKASLKTVNTTFNDSSTFNSGTHVGTVYESGVLKIVGSGYFGVELDSSWTPEWSSIVGYWKLNEASWNGTANEVIDSSGNGLHGVAFSSANTTASGYLGRAGSFDGGLRYVSFDKSQNVNIRSETVLAWVYVLGASTDSPPAIFVAADSSSNNPQFSLGTSSAANTKFKCGGSFLPTFSIGMDQASSLSYNRWYHVACTATSSGGVVTYRLYVNGELDNTYTTPAVTSYEVASNKIRIGRQKTNSTQRTFNGYIDEVAYFSKVLTSDQIKSIYYRQAQAYLTELSSSWTPKWSNLVGYWKMDGNWLDSSGNSLAGSSEVTQATWSSTKAMVGSHSAIFDGADDYITITDSSYLDGSSAMSFLFWVYIDSTITCGSDGYRGILGKRIASNDNQSYSFWLNQCYLSIDIDGSGNRFQSVTQLHTSKWYHVAATFDGSLASANRVKIYIDGTFDRIGLETSTSIPNYSADLLIGKVLNGPNSFKGYIDDVAIFKDSALSSADIALIYNRQKQKYAGSYDSPIIDMGASAATWMSLASVSSLPFSKELPGSSGSETSVSYSSIAGGLMTGLVGYWNLNSNFNAQVGADLTASSAGASIATTNQKFGGGNASFDGASYASASTSSTYSFPNATFSVSFWFRSTMPASSWIISNGLTNTGGGWAVQAASGRLTAALGNANSAWISRATSSATFNDGVWHHAFIQFTTDTTTETNNSMQLYIDGTLNQGAMSYPGTGAYVDPSNTASLALGARKVPASPIQFYTGSIDEVAIWNRALSAAEVLELYRRGANRVKYQARSCIDASCACKAYSTSPAGSASDCDGDGIPNSSDTSDSYAADWIGPDGTASTYFSELQNNTSVDASGNPTGSVNTTGLTLDWSGSFFTAAARPMTNRYFQYRAYMESDDENNLCSGSPCMPEVTSITVGPTGRYYGGSPTVVNNTALSFNQLQTMTRSDTGSCTTYQLSTDGGSTWKWWDGSSWADTSGGVSSSNYLSDFTTPRLQSLTSGNYKFKAFLNTNSSSDFIQSCDLNSVGITYTP